jgi:hypothetical protein
MDSGAARYGKPSRIMTSPMSVKRSFMVVLYQKAAKAARNHKGVDNAWSEKVPCRIHSHTVYIYCDRAYRVRT